MASLALCCDGKLSPLCYQHGPSSSKSGNSSGLHTIWGAGRCRIPRLFWEPSGTGLCLTAWEVAQDAAVLLYRKVSCPHLWDKSKFLTHAETYFAVVCAFFLRRGSLMDHRCLAELLLHLLKLFCCLQPPYLYLRHFECERYLFTARVSLGSQKSCAFSHYQTRKLPCD